MAGGVLAAWLARGCLPEIASKESLEHTNEQQTHGLELSAEEEEDEREEESVYSARSVPDLG